MKYVNMEGSRGRNDGVLMDENDFVQVAFLERKKHPVTDLKLITGGKGGGDGNDWLSPLPVGTIFIIGDKINRQNFMRLRLEVVTKYTKDVLLYDNLFDKPFGCVDPAGFCRQYSCSEIIYIPQQEEQEDGNNSGSVGPTEET